MRPTGSSSGRRVLGLSASVLLACLLSVAPGMAPAVAAADDGVDVRTVSTYTLMPDRGVVRVAVDLTARNTTPDVTTAGGRTRYYFSDLHLAVQPEAVRIAASSGGTKLRTSSVSRSGFREVDVALRSRLFYGRTATVRVTYDLPGGAPRSSTDIRVGTAFATFVAWANGDRAAVRIVLPAGFRPTVSGDPMTSRTSGGRTVLSADAITATTDWYARVDADRPSAMRGRELSIAPGQRISVRAWPEDADWSARVSDRLLRGMPVLDRLIGLTWPVDGTLAISEVHTPLLEGYAGIYHPETRGIEISEDLDDLTILHEASHAWFNGDLFAGRWIPEGLADTYATMALARIGIFSEPPYPTDPHDPAAFPLNDWPPLGRISDDASRRREAYGYETAFGVIQRIVTATGESGMRSVLSAAADREVPYLGAGPPERLAMTPDWRTFLDYLQERGASPNAEAEFGRSVVGDADRSALSSRAEARRAYARLVDDGRGWAPPYAVRHPMSDWRFLAAEQAITSSEAVLAARDRIEQTGDPLGLTPPAGLRTAYEGASSDLAAASLLATEELTAVQAIAAAAERLAAPRDPLITLGLVGEVPDRTLAEAKTAFEANDLPRAVSLAGQSAATMGTAGDRGLRSAAIGGGGLAVWLALALVALLAVRRGRALAAAPPGPGAIPGWRSAGTLASQSSPVTSGSDGGVEPPVIEPFDGPPRESA